MAPRKTSKTAKNATEGMEMILSTEPLKTIWEAADYVGISGFELQEKFAEALNLPAALGWETVPAEHEHLLNEFKAQVNGTQALPETPQETSEPELTQPEPSAMEEEPKAVAAKGKRKSSALTKKKTDAIAKGREASQQTKDGVKQTLTRIQAQAGINDAANAGTTYLQAYQATLNQVKGQGLTVLAAEMIRDLNTDSDFNPDDILADLGIAISADTQQALMEQLAPMLGKSQEATQEVLGTAWGNGIDLKAELLQLETLMNFED